jgi:hypothetical protein
MGICVIFLTACQHVACDAICKVGWNACQLHSLYAVCTFKTQEAELVPESSFGNPKYRSGAKY